MFAMIVIASYTANLAAFLTVETLEKPISSAEDLERQDVIKYGVVNGGSTAKFFQTSANPVYQRMGEFMNSKWTNPNTSNTSVQVIYAYDTYIYTIHYNISTTDNPDVFVGSNDEGIDRVVAANGKYAFFMESSSIQYIIERNCDVTQIGGTLDTKVCKYIWLLIFIS